MNVRWLHGSDIDHLLPTGSNGWRQDYETWIAEAPKERGRFSSLPITTIFACPGCGFIFENEGRAASAGRCTCGSMPYFATFGEYERKVVEVAVERWSVQRLAMKAIIDEDRSCHYNE